jgi:hypothetical protein
METMETRGEPSSVSSRISKGQGYQSRLFKEKGREQFWPKKGNLRHKRKNLKNGQNFTTFRANKMFSIPISFNFFKGQGKIHI